MVSLALSLLFSACRGIDIFVQPEIKPIGDTTQSEVVGFYVLNEGNMGSNKASLDYYDFLSGSYTLNIYQAANPNMPQSLGDVGNDICIYGSRLYAVINCSNLVEVMDAATAQHIGSMNVPNGRYLRFEDGYGYITSYAGPVLIDQNYKQRGYVTKFDTATLQIIDTCHVGFQPDELEVVGSQLYVANSGGYMTPNYENTLSVIDLNTFTCTNTITVARNLHHLRKDQYGQLWVSARGDYFDDCSALYCIDTYTNRVIDTLDIATSNMWLDGDSLYVYGTEWSYVTMSTTITYGIVNVLTHEIMTRNFIHDPSVSLQMPYGIMVHPVSKDIYLTDAKNYVSPGVLWCIGKDGNAKWSVRTGDVPAHMVFRRTNTK